MKNWLKIALVAVLILFAVSGILLFNWTNSVYESTIPLSRYSDDIHYRVEDHEVTTFNPLEPNKTGIIFYHGGGVAHDAYAYIGEGLARQGYTVYFPDMPLSLAVLNPNVAERIIGDNAQINKWVISGHSLGGAMASAFTADQEDLIDGIMLLAAYPPDNGSLKDVDIPQLAIFGERDGLVTKDKREAGVKLLSDNASVILLQGGNHAQFGHYGFQSGDLDADISADMQRDIVIKEFLHFLSQFQ